MTMTSPARTRRTLTTTVILGLCATGLTAPTATAQPLILDTPVSTTDTVWVATYAGEQPQLPATIKVTTDSGETRDAAVQWHREDIDFDQHYRTFQVPGLVEGSLETTAYVEVIPEDLLYFVDAGATVSPAHSAVSTLEGVNLANTTPDARSSASGWGYLTDAGYDGTRPTPAGTRADKASNGHYGKNNSSAALSYLLPNLEPGDYTITVGVTEWWSGPRTMALSVTTADGNATTIGSPATVSSATGQRNAVISGAFTQTEAGSVTASMTRTAGTEAPVIAWLAVSRGVVDVDTSTPSVAAPTISPAGDVYASPREVTLSAPDGATVYYTTDGTTPGVLSGTRYTGPFMVAQNTTVRAIATRNGIVSGEASAAYTITELPKDGYTDVPVGQAWFDTRGEKIQAHGGGFLEHEGWYYWVGENKEHDSALFRSVRLYRSKDLLNWDYVNDILTQSSHPDLADAKVERPKLVYNATTKKFVLWGHWERRQDYAASHLMVAVSDTIDGDYTFIKHFRPGVGEVSTDEADPTYTGGDGKWGYGSRDFTVFIDPDTAKGYLFSAQDHENMRIYPLNDSYEDVDWRNSYQAFVGGHREAPAVAKVNDHYVIVTSGQSGWYPNQSRFAYTTDLDDPDGWSQQYLLGNNTSFKSQPTNIMTLTDTAGKTSYVYMGDRWDPKKLGSSTYVWLPLDITTSTGGVKMALDYRPGWRLDAQTGAISYPDFPLLSQGKSASASSELSGAPASRANDGDAQNTTLTGDSSAYFAPTGVPFTWAVDLGEPRDLSRIDLSWRQWNGSETYATYTVRGSVDGVTWVDLADRSGNKTVGFTSDALAGTYRHVAVEVSSVINDHNGNAAPWAAGIIEAQVYGAAKTTLPPDPEPEPEPDAPAVVTTTTLRVNKITAVYGASSRPTATVKVTAPRGAKPVAGKVAITDGTKTVATLRVGSNGTAKWKVPATFEVGKHTLRAAFTPSNTAHHKASQSSTVRVTINKATPKVTLTAKPTRVQANKPVRLTVKVSAKGVSRPTGRWKVLDGNKVIATGTLTARDKGKDTVTVKLARTGNHRLSVVFAGSTTLTKKTSKVTTIKVVARSTAKPK